MKGLESLILAGAIGCTGSQNIDTGQDSSVDTNDTYDTDSDTDTDTNNAPVISTTTLPSGTVNTAYSSSISATDADGDKLAYQLTSAPSWISLDYFSGVLSGTPTASETDTIEVKVTDSGGLFDTASYTLIITPPENHAPTISTTALPSATTNTAYNSSIIAADIDGDSLTYSLTSAPSWLSINNSGQLSGTPTSSETDSVTVSVSDGSLSASQTYSLLVGSVATLDMDVIDGNDGAGVDDSCSVDVVVTNSTSGKSYSATSVGGVASFNLDETGTYNISVASTNTGSNCYGGVSLDEWVDVSAGSNSGWVTLIPETYAAEVASVVGSQIDMGDIYGHVSGAVDNVTKLVKYMSGIDAFSSSSKTISGWESSIRNGTDSLEVEDFNGYTYVGVDYDNALADAVAEWNGSLAPNVSIVSSGTGGTIYFTLAMDWQTFPDEVADKNNVYTTETCEITYGGDSTEQYAENDIMHEIGHCAGLQHTNVNVFIMKAAHDANKPHELELLVARNLNWIGNYSPRGYPIDVYNGYLE